MNLPMLGNGQDPSSLIGQYQEGVLAKTTRLADLRGKLDIAAPAATRSVHQQSSPSYTGSIYECVN